MSAGAWVPARAGALPLVDDQPGEQFQRVIRHLRCYGGGVEGHPQAPADRLPDQVGDAVDLVLQEQYIPRCKTAERLIHKRLGQAGVGAAVEENAVFPGFRHLDDGVPAGLVQGADQAGIHPVALQRVQERRAARPHQTGVPDLQAGLGGGDGLVQPLAGRNGRSAPGRQGSRRGGRSGPPDRYNPN